MLQNWKTYKLEDIASIKSGKRLPKGHELTSTQTDYRYIRLVNIDGNSIQQDNMLFLEPETQKLISRYIVNETDVCLAIVGHTIGLVFYVDKEYEGVNLTENAARLTDFREGIDSKFIYYSLLSPQGYHNILSRKVGSAQGKLPLYNIRSLEISIPELPEQRAIASILSSLDDKIELNLQMNKTLEEMAMTLYKHWFVDFEFPYSPPLKDKNTTNTSPPLKEEYPQNKNSTNTSPPLKEEYPQGEVVSTSTQSPQGQINNHPTFQAPLLQRRGSDGAEVKGYKSSGGKFIDSELGLIPEGWEVKRLGDFIDLNPRLSIKKGTEASFVEMKALPTDAMSVSDIALKEFKGGSKFQNGDTLFARITPCLENGKTAFVDFLEGEEIAFGSTEFLVMRAKQGISKYWTYCISRDPVFRKFSISTMVGTSGRQRVQNDPFLSYEMAKPPISVFDSFTKEVKPWFYQVRQNTLENQTLTKLRDTLLPKLISGEVRVKDVEQTIGAAL